MPDESWIPQSPGKPELTVRGTAEPRILVSERAARQRSICEHWRLFRANILPPGLIKNTGQNSGPEKSSSHETGLSACSLFHFHRAPVCELPRMRWSE